MKTKGLNQTILHQKRQAGQHLKREINCKSGIRCHTHTHTKSSSAETAFEGRNVGNEWPDVVDEKQTVRRNWRNCRSATGTD